jgi:hypothetical protein
VRCGALNLMALSIVEIISNDAFINVFQIPSMKFNVNIPAEFMDSMQNSNLFF